MKRKEELTEALSDCTLCPRSCHADRLHGQKGVCGMDASVRLARAALHPWEEPCISGETGSGAVFFSGCPLGCCFCQNREIAIGQSGLTVTVDRLSEIFLELQEQGAANINLVTGTHYVPQIILALETAKKSGLTIPVVYNCGGYECAETLRLLEGYVDIYLPDFKYMDNGLAAGFSRARNYPEKAREAIREMVRQTGKPVFDEKGMIKKGTVVRHLVLPGHTKDSIAILKYLSETYGDSIYISVMSQYTPVFHQEKFEELNRRLTKREYEKVLDAAFSFGIENGFYQEGDAAEESFIPPFDHQGVLKKS